jgi:hypothetical protein
MDINFILVYVMKSIFYISHTHTYNGVLTTWNTFNLFPTLAKPELIPSSCWFPSSTSSSFLAAFKWVVDTCTLLINLVLQGDGIWCCRKMEGICDLNCRMRVRARGPRVWCWKAKMDLTWTITIHETSTAACLWYPRRRPIILLQKKKTN